MPSASDEAFRRAAALAPRSHPLPYRLPREGFETLVASAESKLSRDAKRRLSGLQVQLEELPGAEQIAAGLAPDALSARLHSPSETLVVYQGNLENRSRDESELAKLVARTLTRA